MKRFLIIIAVWIQTAVPCPTCVGRIREDSPPFFSDTFYQPIAEKLSQKKDQENIPLSSEKVSKEEKKVSQNTIGENHE